MNESKIIRLKELMSGYDKQINKIENMQLGFLLARAEYNSLRNLIDRDKEFVFGKFGFTVNSHSTGNSVRVDLIAGDGERLNIINGTYWHSPSTYGFNKFHRLNGAWDESFEDAINHIRGLEIAHLNNDFQSWTESLKALQAEDKCTINKFASEFN